MDKSCRLVISLLLLLHTFSCLFSGTKGRELIEEEKDISTPLATNPTIIVPDSNSDASAVISTTPLTIPSPNPPHTSSYPGESWCVARDNVAKIALQAALDYACGIGGADCSEIQQGGKCYNPNSLKQHASFAFNTYYQKNPIPSSCNFGGTALTINSDPSVGSCHFPSTSTSESILNVTSEDGFGLFGRGPSRPHPTPKPLASSSSSSLLLHFSSFFSFAFAFACFNYIHLIY